MVDDGTFAGALYRLLAQTVSARSREAGIRMAHGATWQNVMHTVMSRGIVLTGAGVGIGAVLAWSVTRAMETLLYGVGAADSLTATSARSGEWILSREKRWGVGTPRQLATLPPDFVWVDAMPDRQRFLAIVHRSRTLRDPPSSRAGPLRVLK